MTRASIVAAAVLTLAAAGTANAGIDRTLTITPGRTSVSWRGTTTTSISSQGRFDPRDPAGSCNGFPSTGPALVSALLDYCDQTLVKLHGVPPGSLDFQLPEAGDGTISDWDLYVYTTDPEGNNAVPLTSSWHAGGPEETSIDDSSVSNTYLVVAVPYQTINGTFTGAVTWAPAPGA